MQFNRLAQDTSISPLSCVCVLSISPYPSHHTLNAVYLVLLRTTRLPSVCVYHLIHHHTEAVLVLPGTLGSPPVCVLSISLLIHHITHTWCSLSGLAQDHTSSSSVCIVSIISHHTEAVLVLPGTLGSPPVCVSHPFSIVTSHWGSLTCHARDAKSSYPWETHFQKPVS